VKFYTRLATASDKVYQLLAHGRWLNTINQIKSNQIEFHTQILIIVYH
jgi:hypothetical protein